MQSRIRLAAVVIGLAAFASAAVAGELEGRGRTWTFEVNVGQAILDAGFDEEIFGYTVPSSFRVPPINPDKLESEVPSVGLRVGYNFTRFFGVELSGLSGQTSVGTNHEVTLVPNLQLPFQSRQKVLREQTAVAPLIESILSNIDYNYYGGSLVGVFSFNNRPTSRWTFYFTLGGGGYSLDTKTTAFNACDSVSVTFDPDVPVFNGNPNLSSGRDRVPDNPAQIRSFQQNCARSFPTAAERVFAGTNQIVFGLPTFRDAEAQLLDPSDPDNSPFVTQEGGTCDDLLDCDGTPIFTAPQGVVMDNSLRHVDPIRSLSSAYWTAGGGFRYWVKPRQSIRGDLRRHWDESINKNINEFMLGYSFTVGRGRDIRSAAAAPPPPDNDADGDGVVDADETPPAPAVDADDTGLPEPAGDDPPVIAAARSPFVF